MNAPRIRDIDTGRTLGHLEGDTIRDLNGKITARRVGSDKKARTLSQTAALFMGERSVLMDLGIGDVSTAATQLAIAVPDNAQDYVADAVSSVVYSKHDRGVWYPSDPFDAIKIPIPSTAAEAAPPQLSPKFTPTTFTTTGYALAVQIPRPTRNNADFDLMAFCLRRLVEALRLAREYRVAKLLTTAANYATANQITPVAKWDAGASANPITDVFAGLAASTLPANSIVLSEAVQPFYFGATTSSTVRDMVQAGATLPRPIIGKAKTSSGGAPSYIWGNATSANVPVIRAGTDPALFPTSLTFRWLGEGAPDGERAHGVYVRTYFDNAHDSFYLAVLHNDSEVVTNSAGTVGSLIVGAAA